MKRYSKSVVSDDDLRIIIDLFKNREAIRKEADEKMQLSKSLESEAIKLRAEADKICNREIAEKFDLHKDFVWQLSRGQRMKERVRNIDPEFYMSRE